MINSKKASRPVICLQADSSGTVWGLAKGKTPSVVEDNIFSNLVDADYRVLGAKLNYALITNLYPVMQQNDIAKQLFVGNPSICGDYFAGTSEDILLCLSSLSVHDVLPNCWHTVNGKTFNTFLLLKYFEDEGLTNVANLIFNQHCLRKDFEFIGQPSPLLSVELLSEIVDPRWFIQHGNSHKLSRLEKYFGLRQKTLHTLLTHKDLILNASPSNRRLLILVNFVKNLHDDSFVYQKASHLNGSQKIFFMCRQTLNFIVRNWLVELELQSYFSPDKFFTDKETKQEYQNRFGCPL